MPLDLDFQDQIDSRTVGADGYYFFVQVLPLLMTCLRGAKRWGNLVELKRRVADQYFQFALHGQQNYPLLISHACGKQGGLFDKFSFLGLGGACEKIF